MGREVRMPKAKLSPAVCLPAPNTRRQLHIYIRMKWPNIEMEEQTAASQADGWWGCHIYGSFCLAIYLHQLQGEKKINKALNSLKKLSSIGSG